MRFKLLRRRLSISAPRMIVRSHLPWPFRWAAAALMLGFSAALALWAFEFGKSIAGIDRDATEELQRLRLEVSQLRAEREKVVSIANTAESLLKTERAVQDRLALQLKQAESENLSIKSDLGFFQRLLPAAAADSLMIRALQVEPQSAGRTRYQLLVMQAGKSPTEFKGRYELTLIGLLDGKPWTFAMPGGPQPLQLKQYLRVEGTLEYPVQAVVKSASVRVTDASGAVRAALTVKP